MSLIPGFDQIRLCFVSSMEMHNTRQRKQRPNIDVAILVAVTDRATEWVSSISSSHGVDQEKASIDWAHALDGASHLYRSSHLLTIMHPELRSHPSVEVGTRAVAIPGLVISICCIGIDPNISEAICLKVQNTRGLKEPDFHRVWKISGSDPRQFFPFTWA